MDAVIMTEFIVVLEDYEGRIAPMRDRLNESFSKWSHVFFDNAPDMIEWLSNHLHDCILISLDHDLGPNRKHNGEVFDPGIGRDVVDYLASKPAQCPVIIHSSNNIAAIGMEMALSYGHWTAERVIPFPNLEWIDSDWAVAIARLLKTKNIENLNEPDILNLMGTAIADKIRGIIYGQAIGDALGLGTEGLSKSQVAEYYPNGLRRYSEIVRDRYRSAWVVGDWTDDTDQMLCILDSLVEKQQVDVLDIGLRFYKWASAANPGIGRTTYEVLFSRHFFQPDVYRNYYIAAQKFWEDSEQQAAANGGVMRTSVLGIWEYPFPEKVKQNAEQVCQITHYDPRCVGSSVAVSLAISYLLRGHLNIEDMIQEIALEVAPYSPLIQEYFDKAATESLDALSLGEANKMGYTLKTMAAGFWALTHAASYEDGVLQIIHEGGDADTNAAVAGALLGARFGYSSIPQQWLEELAYKQQLDRKVEQLIPLVQQWETTDC
ncbi:ADP-ribosylglycohydrolase family protein [Argonema galeatum]|uniref:ADP-ribosylglycohydrolase family protein n=1 Tax=Argonema galeatum TaxID=2942762 RepID=UPI0020136D5B|nr:ADP-ribosylglycohydrolase family protein [Argonema galeatum]MCL1466413.1 ADP-ribosylglycohydrolase family protein [Argonema galeatum A003/A1]